MSGEAADDERTIDADPARLAELAGADDERTIDADVDLLDHVRTAVREARDRLAAPPATGAEPAPAEEEGPWLPTSPGGATSSLLPADESQPGVRGSAPPRERSAALPPAVAPVEPARPPEQPPAIAPAEEVSPSAPARTGGGRWQPPPRIRPADVRPTEPLLPDRTPPRRPLDRRWVIAGVVLAIVVSVLVAIAVRGGGDSPDPEPGSTTAPGASTTVG